MRIISKRILKEFWEDTRFNDSEQSLKTWHAITKSANWNKPQEIKDQFRSASFIGDNRAVFNIAGNKYRLIVKFNYPYQIAYIRFIGTHARYDEIDAEKV